MSLAQGASQMKRDGLGTGPNACVVSRGGLLDYGELELEESNWVSFCDIAFLLRPQVADPMTLIGVAGAATF